MSVLSAEQIFCLFSINDYIYTIKYSFDVLVTMLFFHTAYALPMFRQGRETSTKKQEERARRDPVKSHRPDLPIYGPGKNG